MKKIDVFFVFALMAMIAVLMSSCVTTQITNMPDSPIFSSLEKDRVEILGPVVGNATGARVWVLFIPIGWAKDDWCEATAYKNALKTYPNADGLINQTQNYHKTKFPFVVVTPEVKKIKVTGTAFHIRTDIELEEFLKNKNTNNQNISTIGLTTGGLQESSQHKTIAATQSDVDINIPSTSAKNDKTFAVIIANENYQYVSPVAFAKNDGETFKKYCIQTLGLPEKNVTYLTNATLTNIRREVKLTSQIVETYKGEASIIFYYAGHGVPEEKSKMAYLLPIDGEGRDIITSGYKLEELYQEFSQSSAQMVTVFIDACFSGAQRSENGEMVVSDRSVREKPDMATPKGNMVVFSASQNDETACPYKEQGHGMFTYFLLKKLQDTKGNVTFGELGTYITDNVKREALRANRKSQTPTITPSPKLVETWTNLKLK